MEQKKRRERKKKPAARYLRTRIFCMKLDSEAKQILSWTLNPRRFPENVSSCPSDRAVSQGCRGRLKVPPEKQIPTHEARWGGSTRPGCAGAAARRAGPTSSLAGKQGWPSLGVASPSCRAVRINSFRFCRWKAAYECWVLQYQPRGMIQKAEPVWRVLAQRKYIYGNISLATGRVFFPFFDVWPQ